MKIITIDTVAINAFDDNTIVNIDSNKITILNNTDGLVAIEFHDNPVIQLIEHVILPEDYIGGKYTYELVDGVPTFMLVSTE